MVGENLDDANLQQIVDKTIVYADEDGDGKLSFDEFKKIIEKLNITERMTIDQIHQEERQDHDNSETNSENAGEEEETESESVNSGNEEKYENERIQTVD